MWNPPERSPFCDGWDWRNFARHEEVESRGLRSLHPLRLLPLSLSLLGADSQTINLRFYTGDSSSWTDVSRCFKGLSWMLKISPSSCGSSRTKHLLDGPVRRVLLLRFEPSLCSHSQQRETARIESEFLPAFFSSSGGVRKKG